MEGIKILISLISIKAFGPDQHNMRPIGQPLLQNKPVVHNPECDGLSITEPNRLHHLLHWLIKAGLQDILLDSKGVFFEPPVIWIAVGRLCLLGCIGVMTALYFPQECKSEMKVERAKYEDDQDNRANN